MIAQSTLPKGYGDSDPLGWLITLAYLVVAVLCARAALASWRSGRRSAEPVAGDPPPLPARPRAAPWWVLALGALLLGLNKQIDVHLLAREAGTAAVSALGYEEHRRWIGRAVVVALGAGVVWAMVAAARHVRHASRGYRTLMVGLALLAVFVILRAGDYVPYLRGLNLSRRYVVYLVFELGGLLLVGASAWRTRRLIDRSATTAPA
jgi:hypothetical protein